LAVTGEALTEEGFAGGGHDKLTAVPAQTDASREAAAVKHIVGKDLKPQLMVLKSFLGTLDAPDMAELDLKARDVAAMRETVGRLLSHVEQQQERTARHAGEPDVYQVFPTCCPLRIRTPHCV